MKHISILLFVLTAIVIKAQSTPEPQKKCASEIPDEAWNNWFNQQVETFKANSAKQASPNAHYIIPVVFHVIHGGEAPGTFPNLSQAQINSQISVLNDDFSGMGFNVNNISNTDFSPSLIANCNIHFCLAEKDPSGAVLNEKGIHRVNYNDEGWANPTSYTTQASFRSYIENTVKANTIWDPRRYLNIWISNVNNNTSLLGYATFPPSSGLTGVISGQGNLSNDGVWCWSRAIGDVGSLSSIYNKGRTVTHEVGHYLGLRHIWGDAMCGNDFCDDTPTQKGENIGCPSYPTISCNNGPNGDMFINFMDYCNDACLYMFTNDQKVRMQTALSNSPLRMGLIASAATLCNTQQPTCSYTLSNFSNTDTLLSYRRVTASASDLFCPQGNAKAGYTNGTNCYGDKEKAEFIQASKYNMVSNPVVSGVIVLFFQSNTMGTGGNGTTGITLYAGNTENSKPGAVLASFTEDLSTVTATTKTTGVPYCGNPNLAFSQPIIIPHKFKFNIPISVPQSGGFFTSVLVPNAAGDTISILDNNTGIENTAWEKWHDNSWHDMRTAWGNTRQFNLAILPIIECGAVGIKHRSLFDGHLDLFPNPSSGAFTLITSLPSPQNIHIAIYNTVGELVFKSYMPHIEKNSIDINMSNYPNGIYFVELNNGQEKTTKKMMLVK